MKHQYGMYIDARVCLHCDACMIACKAENAVPVGKSRNWVFQIEKGIYPKVSVQIEPGQCMQCENPPCVRVCPTGASFIDENGVVQINPDDCIGCRYCMEACPYDARYFHEESGTVDKCNFCPQRVSQKLDPACVVTCPVKVRVFGDLNDPNSEISKRVATERIEVRKKEAGTSPNVFYQS